MFFSLLVLAISVPSLNAGPMMHPHTFSTTITLQHDLNYLLYLPKDYATADRSWPLVVFLHGSGERGSDVDRVKVHGPPKLVAAGEHFPFILLSPQCVANDYWTTATQLALLDALIDRILTDYRVDPARVYLTGLSMGGDGTWAMATKFPHRFAAIAPVCGEGNPAEAGKIAHIPTWVFHGALDEAVPLEASEAMVKALRQEGSPVKFTVYPEAKHDSWTATYANPALYEWLLSHRRGTDRGSSGIIQPEQEKQ